MNKYFYLGCAILAVWLAAEYYNNEPFLDPVQEMDCKEFLWEMRKVSKRLTSEDKTIEIFNFNFASRSWSTVLEWINHTIVLNLHNKDHTVLAPQANFFLGVGIKQSTGQGIYLWNEIKVMAPNATQAANASWMGPNRDYLLNYEDLILSKDALTFFVRISTYPSPFCVMLEKSQVPHKLSMNLKNLYLKGKDQDVKITVQDVSLGAHSTILRARSPVLAALLSQEVLEIREDDCNPGDFAVFLLFLYSGTVDNLNNENVVSVYNIAVKYEVPDLMEECARYMVSKLTVHSVSNVISVAVKHKDDKLLEHATDFFLRNAQEIFPTVQWQTFLMENPTKANELVIKSYAYQTS